MIKDWRMEEIYENELMISEWRGEYENWKYELINN